MTTRASIFVALTLTLLAAEARAQSKFTHLKDEPAIRHKIEYRDNRFEIVPFGGGTLNSPLRQQVYGGLRFRYHFSDVFAIGIGGFGGTSFPTSTFTGIIQVQDRDKNGAADLPGGEADLQNSTDPAFDDLRRVREVKFGASLDGELTPIYGKISAFGKIFVRYDFSAILGVTAVQTAGIVNVVDAANNPDGQADTDPRFVPGPDFGLQTRLFLNDFLAINVEVRDTLILDNLDGGLVGGQPDTQLNNFVTLSGGLSVFFPTVAQLGK